jgi:hypothetical protein
VRELIEVDLKTNDRNRTSQVAFQLLSLSRSANCVLFDALRIADVSRLSGAKIIFNLPTGNSLLSGKLESPF